MKTFRLDPVEDQLTNSHWRASTIKPVTVWVRADDEKHARQLVTLATAIATRRILGKEKAMPPWKDWGFAKCVEDPTQSPPAGVVLTAEGKTISTSD
jgi:hypothetical protein